MNAIMRFSAVFSVLLLTSCNNSDKNSSTSASATNVSCSASRKSEVVLCTQYTDLSGSALATIQSECELRSSEGFTWNAAACPGNSVGNGSCTLPATAQKPAVGTQFYYGAAFATGDTAARMCTEQLGTFK